MFFYLSKILAFTISPLVWVFALLLYSFKTKIESRKKKLRIAAVIVLYLYGNSFLVDELYRAYEPVTPDYYVMDDKYDGAIVLGGIGDIDLRLEKINFNMSGDRLFQTLPLYYTGRIKKLIFTGGSGKIEFPEKREAVYVKKYLQSINFPDSALIVETNSRNTYENAMFTKKIMDSLNITNGKYFLVTSAFHTPRAMAIFKKAGYKNLTPYITNRQSGVRRFTFDFMFIPNPEAMFKLEILIHEWVGFLVYKVKGWA
ncbi:MAG: YdcF family protein [Bacteroidetes bacterium]|nr:YdcF family protein [Bacteroidota bacterium]